MGERTCQHINPASSERGGARVAHRREPAIPLGAIWVGVLLPILVRRWTALRHWWRRMGRRAYPQATTLYITADSGGSIGVVVRSRQVKGAGSAPTEGARRATGVGADAAAMGSGALAPGQRWSASRKRDVVLRLLRSEPLDAVSPVWRSIAWRGGRSGRWPVSSGV